jgi:hypothetical protein
MIDKERKALELIRNIKNPKLRAELKRDIEKLIKLKAERDKQNKIFKYHDKYRSTKLH